jgi:glyceraldehyde-3-phosphate dehydrogenase/erythrose-4-phosphate dehydrogenase
LNSREFASYGKVIHISSSRKKQFDKFIKWATDYDNNLGIANRTLDAREKWLNTNKVTPGVN